MSAVKKYEEFMKAHSVPKDAPKDAIKTNARIPSKPGKKNTYMAENTISQTRNTKNS
jgi:hypothetical protein